MAGPDVRARRIHRLVRRVGVPDIAGVPGGRELDLPGRGSTYIVDIPGPRGAPPMILLHGTASTALLNWFPVLEGLSEKFRLILFDQRWHGRGIRSGAFRIADCTDDVIAVADALDLPNPICAGYSLGGAVALNAAHLYPDRVAGLVLCATPYKFRETRREKVFHQVFGLAADLVAPFSLRRAEKLARRLPEAAGDPWVPGDFERWAMAEFRSTSPWALTQVIAEIGRFDASAWLHTLDTPTAVVITTRDRAVPVYRQVEMATMIPGATIHLARTGHTGCVFGADRFVPAVLVAADAVAARL
ncbi:alpha/beta fold hydrolase [Nocardia higoensis]|uniref:alpha/beta fold hydrolase n=1 Tax=Nocardia higoensis TaxID=228599 RepID=UPI0002E1B992|nr:alpha/beta hydrolase [Nocardia higoensis]